MTPKTILIVAEQSFLRFLGMGLSDKAPDAKTIWLFRELLTEAGAIAKLFTVFDARLKESAERVNDFETAGFGI